MPSKKKLELYIRNTTGGTIEEIQNPVNFPWEKVEMFKDESVTLTQTVKNVKDPAKVFTPFTRKFTVPTSKQNNKIFRHFYNNGISGFDSRIKIPAKLELNTSPFQDGYIKLESSAIENNRPKDYKLTFFGNTVALTQLFGEDTLRNLDWLDNFSFPYDAANIRARLENFPSDSTVVDGVTYTSSTPVCLISNEKRWFYNSAAPYIQGNGNLYPQAGNIQGCYWEDLKPSLDIDLIFIAIEKSYPEIEFDRSADTIFNDGYFTSLVLHLSKTQGRILNTDDNTPQTFPQIVNTFPLNPVNNSSTTPVNLATSNGSDITIAVPSYVEQNSTNFFGSSGNEIRVYIRPLTAYLNTIYSAQLLYNGTVVDTLDFVFGIQTIIPSAQQQVTNGTFRLIIAPTSLITFDLVEFRIKRGIFFPTYGLDFWQSEFQISNVTFNPNFEFNITENVPKIKIIEFLSGIFKMFNIIAEVKFNQTNQKQTIILKDYNKFYFGDTNYINGYKTIDITQYVDAKEQDVSNTLPYNMVKYKYKGLETFFADYHNQLFGQEWGTENYRGATDGVFVGKPYTIEVPFEFQKYERIWDTALPDSQTQIQWGWTVDNDRQPILGKPLIHRATFIDEGTLFSFMPTENSVGYIENYRIPTSASTSGSQISKSLAFFPETNEFSGAINQQTLFTEYHQRYIEGIFEQSKRLVKVTAYLPDSVLFDLSLANRFVIGNNTYMINSIKTNFATGKSELELLTEDLNI